MINWPQFESSAVGPRYSYVHEVRLGYSVENYMHILKERKEEKKSEIIVIKSSLNLVFIFFAAFQEYFLTSLMILYQKIYFLRAQFSLTKTFLRFTAFFPKAFFC